MTRALDIPQCALVTDMIMEEIAKVKGDLDTKLADLMTKMEAASNNFDDMNAKLTTGSSQQETMVKFMEQQKKDLENAQQKIAAVELSSRTSQQSSQGLLDQVRTQEAELTAKLHQTRLEIGAEFNTQRDAVNTMVRTAIKSLMPDNAEPHDMSKGESG